MTMDENSLRSALGVIASDPEPPSTIDIAAARRRGRRRQRAGRAVVPVTVALAVALAVTVPRVLQRQASPAPVLSAPARFDPLVPYADFGWLPPGYSETVLPFAAAELSAPDEVVREARAGERGARQLALSVYPRGGCNPLTLRNCAFGESHAMTRTSFNGRPAWAWSSKTGSGFVWEYAPGAWAALVSTLLMNVRTPVPPASSLAQLREIAARVKFGQRKPMAFPYRLTGLSAGWQVRQARVTMNDQNGCTATLGISPASSVSWDPGAIIVSVWWKAPPCERGYLPDLAGTRVTKYGVTWYYQYFRGDPTQSITTTGPAVVTSGLGIFITAHQPSPYGDVFEVYHQMTLLGTNPANWTTRPFGKTGT